MERPLRSFPLANSHKAKLAEAGYETAGDLKSVRVGDLSRELSVSHGVAVEILKIIRGENMPRIIEMSALELLRKEQQQTQIVTFSATIDEMLGGGVHLGKITEFCGAPGIGKTQMSIQLAVDATIPADFGGVEGETVYIDTEGSFIVERVAEIANAAVNHITSVSQTDGDPGLRSVADQYTLEHVLSKIHYYRCHSYLQLVAIVNTLPDFISKQKVKLIVIDSIASHFRHDFTDMGLRNRILSGLAQNLIRMATHHDIAVVLTNQMTTRFDSSDGRGAQLVPALGESWGHASTIRVILHWDGETRLATLIKSPTHKESTVSYVVTQDGVRDGLVRDSFPLQDSTNTEVQPPPTVSVQMQEASCEEKEEEEEDSFESSGFTAAALMCDLDNPESQGSVNKRSRIEEV